MKIVNKTDRNMIVFTQTHIVVHSLQIL